jgi:DNA mismatch endonuclease, patch repair protein
MARVRRKDTDLEKAVCAELKRRRLRFSKHAKHLPGCPDIVFGDLKIAIFIDGDFWHGYRFPVWRHSLSTFWQQKINKNRIRDRRNFAHLRRMGWRVLRIWQHQIKRDAKGCGNKIIDALRK